MVLQASVDRGVCLPEWLVCLAWGSDPSWPDTPPPLASLPTPTIWICQDTINRRSVNLKEHIPLNPNIFIFKQLLAKNGNPGSSLTCILLQAPAMYIIKFFWRT